MHATKQHHVLRGVPLPHALVRDESLSFALHRIQRPRSGRAYDAWCKRQQQQQQQQQQQASGKGVGIGEPPGLAAVLGLMGDGESCVCVFVNMSVRVYV